MEPDPFFELFPLLFAGASLVILAVIAFIVVATRRNHGKVKLSRREPMTSQADLPKRTLDSEPLRPEAPARTIKQRLEELEALRAAGTITPEEHAAARAEILRGS